MIGPHFGRGGGRSLLDRCRTCCGPQLRCCQFYARGPRGDRCLIDDAEGAILKDLEIVKVTHASLTCLPLGKPEWFKKILGEMEIGRRVGAYGVVVHIKNGWREHLPDFMEFLSSRARDDWPILFLENHAVKSNAYTLDDAETIDYLVSVVKGQTVRVGVCFDTAHLWGNGVPLSTRAETEEFLTMVPIEIPVMFHLNDSAVLRGSGVDRHAPVGGGVIWGGVTPIKERIPSTRTKSGTSMTTRYVCDQTKVLPYHESGAAAIIEFAERHSLVVILESGASPDMFLQIYSW